MAKRKQYVFHTIIKKRELTKEEQGISDKLFEDHANKLLEIYNSEEKLAKN